MSTIPLQPNDTYYRRFTVRDSAGDLVEADALPTAIVYRNGAPTAITVTITPLSGPAEYDLSFVIPGNATNADQWQLLISGTAGGAPLEQWLQLAQTIFLGSVVRRGFTVRDGGGTGQAADALPTVTVLRNNLDEATPVTVSQVGSPTEGKYILAFTVDAAWAKDDELQVRINATLGGVPVERLWFMGQITDVTTISVTTLDVQSDEQAITVDDEEQGLTLTDPEQTIILECDQ